MIRVIFLTLSIWCIIRSIPCLLCIFCSEVRCSGDDPICWQDRALILNRGDLSDYLQIAAELGTHRITVNGYCPGNIDTPMSSSFHPKLILEWFSYLCVWSAQHDSNYWRVQIQKPSRSRWAPMRFLLIVPFGFFYERKLTMSPTPVRQRGRSWISWGAFRRCKPGILPCFCRVSLHHRYDSYTPTVTFSLTDLNRPKRTLRQG